MVHHFYLEQLTGPSPIRDKIGAVRTLTRFSDDFRVVDALCETAITTTSHRLREILIDALKTNPAGACEWFMGVALWSPIPSRRRWALVCLSLLDCREAKAAVIRGLSDTHASVREAAAMSAGLYDDGDVLSALERYFESHRFHLTLAFIGTGVETLRKKADIPDDDDGSGHATGVLQPC